MAAGQIGKQEALKGCQPKEIDHVTPFAVGTLVAAPLNVGEVQIACGTRPTVARQAGFAHHVINFKGRALRIPFRFGDVELRRR